MLCFNEIRLSDLFYDVASYIELEEDNIELSKYVSYRDSVCVQCALV